VQITYKQALYPAGYILPATFSLRHSWYFASISFANSFLSPLPQQICIKMNVCN